MPSGWKSIKKYTHYLDYENYSQSVLSKLISGSFAFGKFCGWFFSLSLHVKEFTISMQCNDRTRWKLTKLLNYMKWGTKNAKWGYLQSLITNTHTKLTCLNVTNWNTNYTQIQHSLYIRWFVVNGLLRGQASWVNIGYCSFLSF